MLVGTGGLVALALLIALAVVVSEPDSSRSSAGSATRGDVGAPQVSDDGDLRTLDLGSFAAGEAISITLEPDDVSFLLTATGESRDEPLSVAIVTDPNGSEIYRASPSDGTASGGLTNSVRTGYSAPEVSIIAPAHPGLDVEPGVYEVVLDNIAEVDASVTIKSGTVDPTVTQALDINIWLASPDLEADLLEAELAAQVDTILRTQNLALGEFTVSEAPAADVDRFSEFDTDDDIGGLCAAASADSPSDRTLDIALIDSFSDTTVGFSSGLPGALPGSDAVARCVAVAGRVEGEVVPLSNMAATLVHEGAHYMGLLHTTEQEGEEGDDFDDTPDCDLDTYDGRDNFGYAGEEDGEISATECGLEGGADNFMFLEDSPQDVRDVLTQTEITDDQAWALRRHPLFYAVE